MQTLFFGEGCLLGPHHFFCDVVKPQTTIFRALPVHVNLLSEKRGELSKEIYYLSMT